VLRGYSCGIGPATPYPPTLRALLQRDWPVQASSIAVENAGKPGEFSGDGVLRIQTTLQASHDLVVILEGSNDAGIPGIGPVGAANNLRQMVDYVQGQGKKVVLCTLPPTVPVSGSEDYHAITFDQVVTANIEIRKIFAEHAGDPNFAALDLFDVFMNTDGSVNSNLLSFDGLHFSQAGFDTMALAVEDAVNAKFRGLR
jgi:lysophospholipase L1-like esterase